MTNSFDLIVVGAGALGTFHAYTAGKQGKKVLLLERDSRPNEATVRNFGQVVPSGQKLGRWRNYGKRSLEIYREIKAEADISIREFGSVYIANDDNEMQLLEEMLQINKEDNYACHLLSREQIKEQYPAIKSEFAKGALKFDQEVSAESELLIHQVIAYIQKKYDITYIPNSPVVSCETKGDQVEVVTGKGEKYLASKAAICNGHEFKTLYGDLFQNSGLIICKLQMMATKPLTSISLKGNILTDLTIRRYEAFENCSSYKAITAEYKNKVAQELGIHILFKQRVDGSIIIGDSHEYKSANDFEGFDFGLSMDVNRVMIEEAQKIINLPDWTMNEYWAGIYSQHPDDLFEHTIDNRIFITTGIGGKGMTASAALSEEKITTIFNS